MWLTRVVEFACLFNVALNGEMHHFQQNGPQSGLTSHPISITSVRPNLSRNKSIEKTPTIDFKTAWRLKTSLPNINSRMLVGYCWIEFKSLYGKIWTCYETKWLLHHASPTYRFYCNLRVVFHSLAFDASVHFDIAEVRVNNFTPTQICPRKRLDYLHNQQPEVPGYQWMLLCCKVFSLTSPFTFLCETS